MVIYNYNETKAVYIPKGISVNVELKITPKSTLNLSGISPYINPYPAFLSLQINGILLFGKALTHDDSDHTKVANFYTEEEEKHEVEKAKLLIKTITKKLQDGNHSTDEYYIAEDCKLINYLDK